VKYIPVVARWICWVIFDKGLGDKNVGDGVGAGDMNVGDGIGAWDMVVDLLEELLPEILLLEVEPNTSPLKKK